MKPTVSACVAGSAALVAAVLAGLAPAGTAGAADQAAQVPLARSATSIDFGSCSGFSGAGASSECGRLSVPLDWSKPNGKKISLAVSRVKAKPGAGAYQGVMLVNPGGPGAAGLALSGLQGAIPDGAGETYDWIGFDPRGVGASKPAISCIKGYEVGQRPNYVPPRKGKSLTTVEKQWLARSKKYAKACGKKHGALLENMRTVDWVRDMEAMRQALGADKINFYGFSYGTYLGQVYATRYPQRVRRMVLDGNVDPSNVWYRAQLSQNRAFEKSADAFFGWVASHDDTYDLGTSASQVEAKYYAVLAELTKAPQDGIDANEWTDTFVRTMYAEFLWPDSAGAFASWVHDRDMDELKVAYEGGREDDDNLFAVYNAVQCTDNKWPQSYKKTWRPDAFKTAAKAPLLTWSNVWFNTACLYWPAKAGKPVKVDGSKAPPILLINATLDGATPYSGALEVRKRLPQSRLIAEKGSSTHSGSLNGNNCLDRRIAEYLATGKLPARQAGRGADVTCPASPKPDPGLKLFGAAAARQPNSLPAPTPEPARDQSLLDSVIGVLPHRAR